MRNGTKSAPAWTRIIMAAERWSRPPWELAPGGAVLWWLRDSIFRDIQAQVREMVRREHEAKQKARRRK
jgi:hypothetical protein